MKKKKLRSIIYILIILPFLTFGQQDSLDLLTKNFKFEDGIYLSFEDFKQNKPSISWDSVYASLHTNPRTFITLVDSIHLKANNQGIEEIWGFSLGGIPYLDIDIQNEAGLRKYKGIKVRGGICYYSIEEQFEQAETITAYNPLTGIPFRQAEVMTEQKREKPFMMSFETGEIADFNTDNFLDWIQDDAQLVKTVKELPIQDRAKKLFKCLLIYVDRNPVYVPVRE